MAYKTIFILYIFCYIDKNDSILANVGEEVTLNCSIYDALEIKVDTIIWFKYSEPISKYISISDANSTIYGEYVSNKIQVYNSKDLKTTAISISGIDVSDTGYYGCKFYIGDCIKEYSDNIELIDTVYFVWTSSAYTTRVQCYIISSTTTSGHWVINGVRTDGSAVATLLADSSHLIGSNVIELIIYNSFDDTIDAPICSVDFEGMIKEYSINIRSTMPNVLYNEYNDIATTLYGLGDAS
ncbi:V-type Ig domain [Turkeypox virus]|uniref:Hemagglutinin n=1 Tax=Turkeypox virus TaxID=336486 RepID=A0A0M3ZRR6_9POXV|nr:V-type Ig domain [Turkeypox virus]ALA62522.1 V-type Ig domain [Turkeypox virus]